MKKISVKNNKINEKKFLLKLEFLVISVIFVVFGIGYFLGVSANDTPKDILSNSIGHKLSDNEYFQYYNDISLTISYFDLYLNMFYPIEDVEELDDETKTMFLLNLTTNYKDKNITRNKLENYKNKYFYDFELVSSDIKFDDQVLYEYKNNKYTYKNTNIGVCDIYSKEISSDAYDNKWIIKKKNYYVRPYNNSGIIENRVYSNIDDCLKNKDNIYSFVGDVRVLENEDYLKVEDALYTYIYTFSKNDNKYIMDSIIIE